MVALHRSQRPPTRIPEPGSESTHRRSINEPQPGEGRPPSCRVGRAPPSLSRSHTVGGRCGLRCKCGRVYEADPAQGNERVCLEAERLIGNRDSNRKGLRRPRARYLHFDYPEHGAEVDVMVVPAGTRRLCTPHPHRGHSVWPNGLEWAYSHIGSAVGRAPEIADSTLKQMLAHLDARNPRAARRPLARLALTNRRDNTSGRLDLLAASAEHMFVRGREGLC